MGIGVGLGTLIVIGRQYRLLLLLEIACGIRLQFGLVDVLLTQHGVECRRGIYDVVLRHFEEALQGRGVVVEEFL